MNSEMLGISLAIAATIISIYNTILFYRQSKLIEKQTLIQRSRIYPHVKIKEVQVTDNTFRLLLENVAESPAFELGLMIAFIPCSPSKKHWIFIDEIFSANIDEAKAYPKNIVIPLKNKSELCRIYGKEEDVYEAKALFLLSSSKKDVWEGHGKAETFEELKTRLINQKVGYVAVMASLVYKDVAETVTEYELIKAFMVLLKKHRSLEEAWREGIPFHDRTVGYEEIPFMDYEFYRHAKGYRGRLESLD